MPCPTCGRPTPTFDLSSILFCSYCLTTFVPIWEFPPDLDGVGSPDPMWIAVSLETFMPNVNPERNRVFPRTLASVVR